MSGAAYFLLFLILLVVIIAIAYVAYTRIRAQRAGHSPPPLSSYIPFLNRNRQSQSRAPSTGILGNIRSKISSWTGGSSSRPGAYEQPLSSGRGRGLDPDGAWDTRVGDEADAYGSGGYYEEQELQAHPSGRGTGPYSGGGYGGHGTELPDYGDEEMGRGRSISREGPGFIGGGQKGLDERFEEEARRENPFGDQAERSQLRGVSPRPADEGRGEQKQSGDSPVERRSMFHENV